jgi:hypothetical protein
MKVLRKRGSMLRSGSGMSAALGVVAGGIFATQVAAEARAYCSATAEIQFHACTAEARDDFRVGRAVCLNLADPAERSECFAENRDGRDEARELCSEQLAARKALCSEIGEARYDPSFEPEDFDDDFTDLTSSNPYFPLAIGNRWELAGDETIEIEVRDATKLIEGVTCVVVNDRVEVDGRVVEDTDDWFAQAKNGDVYYCGEEVKDYEFFAGDDPEAPELVSIDGSFKAGRDGDKPGISVPGAPIPGAVYRQEYSAGNAEDAARVLSADYDYGEDPDLDQLVPQDLAELLCSDDCLVTHEFSPTEPGAFGRKYYAPGIGFFLETGPAEGAVVQLVGCNFDPRCALLPQP